MNYLACPRFAVPLATVAVLLQVILAACLPNGTDDPGITPTPTLPIAGTASTIMPTPGVSPTPTYSAALEAILSPGNTFALPDWFYFQADTDIWRIRADGTERPRPVATELRIGPWAQEPTRGDQAAIVTYLEVDGREAEAIRLVRGHELLEQPLYGPVATSGSDARAAITSIDWSWDGTKLAASFADGTIGILSVPTDPAGFPVEPGAIERPIDTTDISGLSWSPNGAGVAYSSASPNGSDLLYITPAGDIARSVIDSRPVRTFQWLPGRGRLVFVEESGGPANRLPGSIFTVAPDGGSLELLLSAGRFAPAATITAIDASPDGREMAVSVAVPDTDGQPRFHSLWILSIESGDLREVPIAPGFRVVQTWWTSAGLVWRGIDADSGTPHSGFTGVEPFILSRFDAITGTSTIIFQQ